MIVTHCPRKGVELTIHGRLATVLATLEAWRNEEVRLREEFQKTFQAQRDAGAFRTAEDRIRFMERVNAELESKKRSFARLQVSVIAGAGFEGFLPRCFGLNPSFRGPRQVKNLDPVTKDKNPRQFF